MLTNFFSIKCQNGDSLVLTIGIIFTSLPVIYLSKNFYDDYRNKLQLQNQKQIESLSLNNIYKPQQQIESLSLNNIYKPQQQIEYSNLNNDYLQQKTTILENQSNKEAQIANQILSKYTQEDILKIQNQLYDLDINNAQQLYNCSENLMAIKYNIKNILDNSNISLIQLELTTGSSNYQLKIFSGDDRLPQHYRKVTFGRETEKDKKRVLNSLFPFIFNEGTLNTFIRILSELLNQTENTIDNIRLYIKNQIDRIEQMRSENKEQMNPEEQINYLVDNIVEKIKMINSEEVMNEENYQYQLQQYKNYIFHQDMSMFIRFYEYMLGNLKNIQYINFRTIFIEMLEQYKILLQYWSKRSENEIKICDILTHMNNPSDLTNYEHNINLLRDILSIMPKITINRKDYYAEEKVKAFKENIDNDYKKKQIHYLKNYENSGLRYIQHVRMMLPHLSNKKYANYVTDIIKNLIKFYGEKFKKTEQQERVRKEPITPEQKKRDYFIAFINNTQYENELNSLDLNNQQSIYNLCKILIKLHNTLLIHDIKDNVKVEKHPISLLDEKDIITFFNEKDTNEYPIFQKIVNNSKKDLVSFAKSLAPYFFNIYPLNTLINQLMSLLTDRDLRIECQLSEICLEKQEQLNMLTIDLLFSEIEEIKSSEIMPKQDLKNKEEEYQKLIIMYQYHLSFSTYKEYLLENVKNLRYTNYIHIFIKVLRQLKMMLSKKDEKIDEILSNLVEIQRSGYYSAYIYKIQALRKIIEQMKYIKINKNDENYSQIKEIKKVFDEYKISYEQKHKKPYIKQYVKNGGSLYLLHLLAILSCGIDENYCKKIAEESIDFYQHKMTIDESGDFDRFKKFLNNINLEEIKNPLSTTYYQMSKSIKMCIPLQTYIEDTVEVCQNLKIKKAESCYNNIEKLLTSKGDNMLKIIKNFKELVEIEWSVCNKLYFKRFVNILITFEKYCQDKNFELVQNLIKEFLKTLSKKSTNKEEVLINIQSILMQFVPFENEDANTPKVKDYKKEKVDVTELIKLLPMIKYKDYLDYFSQKIKDLLNAEYNLKK